MNDLTTMEDKIAARINTEATNEMMMSDGSGGVLLANMGQVMEFAKMMSIAQVGVRKHLRGNPGACLAVCVQALEWRMSPFQVANKSYVVNDQIAYEASLIHAVVQSRAPIKGRVKVEYSGDGTTRKCKVWAELADGSGEIVSYESPEFKNIKTKNSPLWISDPDQQFFYFSVHSWCRRHFPDVILGVYAPDDIAYAEPLRSEIAPSGLKDRLLASPSNTAGFSAEHINRETGEVNQESAKEDKPVQRGIPQEKVAEPEAREQKATDLAYDDGCAAFREGAPITDIPAQYRGDADLAEAWTDGHKMASAEQSE